MVVEARNYKRIGGIIMNVKDFIEKLNEMGVPKSWYSINGGLKSDTCILNEVHNYWEYFYFDERGNTNGYKRFNNENDACIYFLNVLKSEMEFVYKIDYGK